MDKPTMAKDFQTIESKSNEVNNNVEVIALWILGSLFCSKLNWIYLPGPGERRTLFLFHAGTDTVF